MLATGDIHVVPLRAGLAASSVPSKTYSILAAGRPLLASVDPGTEVARVVAAARVPAWPSRPDDADAFLDAVADLASRPDELGPWAERGRAWVERWVSPAAVAEAYERLFAEVGQRQGARRVATLRPVASPPRGQSIVGQEGVSDRQGRVAARSARSRASSSRSRSSWSSRWASPS